MGQFSNSNTPSTHFWWLKICYKMNDQIDETDRSCHKQLVLLNSCPTTLQLLYSLAHELSKSEKCKYKNGILSCLC